MIYSLIDDGGVNTLEMDLIIPIGTYFLHEYGLYKVTDYDKESINCNRFFNSQFYDFFNELKSKYNVYLDADGYIVVDMYNNAVNYERYLLDDGSFVNNEAYKILTKYKSIKDKLYFEWQNYEVAQIVFDICDFE